MLNSDPDLSSTVFKWVVNILSFPYTFIGICALLLAPSFEIKVKNSLGLCFALCATPAHNIGTYIILLVIYCIDTYCIKVISSA